MNPFGAYWPEDVNDRHVELIRVEEMKRLERYRISDDRIAALCDLVAGQEAARADQQEEDGNNLYTLTPSYSLWPTVP